MSLIDQPAPVFFKPFLRGHQGSVWQSLRNPVPRRHTGSDAGESSSTGGGVKLASNEQCSPGLESSVPRSPGSYYLTLVPTTQPDRYLTTQLPGSVYAALFNNGSMMGITCSISIPGTSRPTGPEIPESLHPTKLQMTTIHPLWIDRFPFPKMRDNMITLLGIINEEEFLSDLFCLTSFCLEPGAPSWDPASWKIGREFSEKWGYLFY